MSTSSEVRTGSVHAQLQILEATITAIGFLDLADLPGPAAAEVFTRAQGLADQLRAVALRALPGVEADGLWALEGHRTAAGWVAQRTRVSLAAARRDLRLARALHEELPATADALRTGRIGLEHARVLATVAATSPTRREALHDPDSSCDEDFLVHHAQHLPVDPFRSLTRRWAAAADPDTDERGYREATDREYLQLSPTLGGYHLAGFLTHEHGTTVATALHALTPPPCPDDTRTTAQRRAGALLALARTALDHDLTTGTGTAVRPHLNIHLDVRTLAPGWAARLQAADTPTTAGVLRPTRPDLPALPGPATFDDGTPLPLTVLRRLACDSQATRILLGPGSTVLDVGRSTRTVTGQLRRAVITRDRHCAYPGCHAPPHHCEIHHPHHWADGGPTSLTNSVLLCWHHHDHVHRNGITVTSRARPDGSDTAGTLQPRWTFHDRHGRPLGGGTPQSRPPPA